MTEGSVTQIVAKSDCLCDSFIQVQSPCNSCGNLGNLKGMREPPLIMVLYIMWKNLCLMLQSFESLRPQNPVAVSMVLSTEF